MEQRPGITCTRRPWPLRLLAAAFGLLSTGAAASPATLNYDLYFSGLKVLSAAFEIEFDRDSYRISASAETTGLVGALASWETFSMSSGLLVDNRPVPRLHAQNGRWRGKTRQVSLGFASGEPVVAQLVPEPQEEEREPVPEQLTVDSIDILSAVVGIGRSVADGGGCNGTWPVFDGRRRFDLIVTEIGRTEVPASSRSAYQGQALHCQLEPQLIAGASRQPSRERRAGEPPRVIDVWLAPLRGSSTAIPVHMTAGPATMYLRTAD